MEKYFEVDVYNAKGDKVAFEKLPPEPGTYSKPGYTLRIGPGSPAPFTIKPDSKADTPAKITYRYSVPLRNFHEVIVPDAGRHYMNSVYLVNFWSKELVATAADVKMPITIITGQDLKTALSFGVIGEPVETRFSTLDFVSPLGTLVVYRKRLTLQIERGFDRLLLPDDMMTRAEDGSVTEHIYTSTGGASWFETLRDFAKHQRRLMAVEDNVHLPSLEPVWCSWTDWLSADVDEQLVLDSVKEGVAVGIKNYILDDGWFGAGLDTEGAPNILGDYYPDESRFPDMRGLSRRVRELGGRLILWVGPHCVARGTQAEKEVSHLFIVDENGEPTHNGKYYTVCYMSPDGRKYMRDLIVRLITDCDADGVKMDLFNGVRARVCTSNRHVHDTGSLTQGLRLLLKEIHEAATALKPDFVIELKQNYATPFLSKYGTLTRAGDAPYNNEGNFMRTIFVQAYTDVAENDYMTVTGEDSPFETAAVVIKMIAVGVPAYSNNFQTMPQTHKDILRHYHFWYSERLPRDLGHREPCDAQLNVWKAGTGNDSAYFAIRGAEVVGIGGEKRFEILNGTARGELAVKFDGRAEFSVTAFDMYGKEAGTSRSEGNGIAALRVPAGGRAVVER